MTTTPAAARLAALAEVRAAAQAGHDGPLTQDQADLVAAILAPHQDRRTAA